MLRKILSRTFTSSVEGSDQLARRLMFAKRAHNGQGSMFKFHYDEETAGESKVNVSYSTFWNDFSHYSAYGMVPPNRAVEEPVTPLAYWDMSEFQGMFQDG